VSVKAAVMGDLAPSLKGRENAVPREKKGERVIIP
jgi:hypothetical protein